MDLLFHLLLPVLVLLALRVRVRYALGLAPLALLPDLDGMSTMGHRIYLHNVFVLALVALVAYLVARRIEGGKDARLVGLVAAFFLGSHLVLDLADPTGWLFPLTDRGFYLSAGLVGDFRGVEHAYYPLFRAGSVLPEGAWSYPQVEHFAKDHHLTYMISPQAIQAVLLMGIALAAFGRPFLAHVFPRNAPRRVPVRVRPPRVPVKPDLRQRP